MRGAASIIHAKALITGGDPATVTSDGVSYAVVKRYPAASSVNTSATSIVVLNPSSDFTIGPTPAVAGTVQIQHARADTPASCYIQYVEPATLGAEPTITSVLTGC